MTAKLPIPLEPTYSKGSKGRPAIQFCDITAGLITNWLAEGNFECDFYKLPECPPWLTRWVVGRWRDERDTFATAYARARAAGAEILVKAAQDGLIEAEGRDGIYKARELANLLRWRASRLNPRDFGDTLDVNVAGTIEHKPVTMAPDWLRKAVTDRVETIEHDPDPESQ